MPRPEQTPSPFTFSGGGIPSSPESSRERIQPSTHIIRARFPKETPLLERYTVETDPLQLKRVTSDEALFPGGHTTLAVKFRKEADTTDISAVLRDSPAEMRFVAIGAQTSITGASVPMGEVVLDMGLRKGISEIKTNERGDKVVKVESGVTLREFQEHLKKDGHFLPSALPYPEATVVGAISTDGAGTRSYKYGKTREYVQGLTMVLPSGEVISMERGQYLAQPGENGEPDYFELERNDGTSRRINVPTYKMPDVPKVSAGYYAKQHTEGEQHGMDLIDLVIGSEGTLGVITEATIKVMKEPPTAMFLVSCDSDKQAFDLITRLRTQEPDKRETREPGGVSAVEYIGGKAIDLVRKHGKSGMPKGANALLLVQMELPEGSESLEKFLGHANAAGVKLDKIAMADPDDDKTKGKFIEIRESVPLTINDQIGLKKLIDPKVTKVGADPCVRPEDLGALMAIFEEEFHKARVEYFAWGHGEGNIHANALPTTGEEVEKAKAAVIAISSRVIRELKGTPLAEHGVGKNLMKQKLLLELYKEKGIAEMRAVKEAFDPTYRLARGNIFPAPALAA